MESTLSVINAMPSTKGQLESFVSKTVAEVEAGNINPLELKAQLKFIEAAIEQIDKQTKEYQLNELSKHGKVCSFGGYKMEQVEAATKYDFSNCNDTLWNDLDMMIKSLNEQKKERESFLKNIKQPICITDEHTGGETIVINPPIKTSTTTLKLTMEK